MSWFTFCCEKMLRPSNAIGNLKVKQSCPSSVKAVEKLQTKVMWMWLEIVVVIVKEWWGCSSKFGCFSLLRFLLTLHTQSWWKYLCLNSCLEWKGCELLTGCIWMPQHLWKLLLLPICYVVVCLIAGKKCCDPSKPWWWWDVVKMHGPLLEVQLQASSSIGNRLSSLHMKPSLRSTPWTLLLSWLCVHLFMHFVSLILHVT